MSKYTVIIKETKTYIVRNQGGIDELDAIADAIAARSYGAWEEVNYGETSYQVEAIKEKVE